MEQKYKIFFWFLILSFSRPTNEVNAQDLPNIILIMCDYMGYADTEPFGSTEIKTPTISKLAQEGITYTNCYTSAPVCVPARAAILTGLYPFKMNLGDGNLGSLIAKYPSIANKLKKQGYRTGFVGKWHLGHSDLSSPNANGFDYSFGFDD